MDISKIEIEKDKQRSAVPHCGHSTIIEYVRYCLAADNLQAFYHCRPWRRLAKEVLQENHNECQECKARGRYTRATHVHHVNHIRDYPELAMSKLYLAADGTPQRNLAPVCRHCHENICHPERFRKAGVAEPLTPERW
jgi:hypothetical protein